MFGKISSPSSAPSTYVFNGPIILSSQFSEEILLQRLSERLKIPLEEIHDALRGVEYHPRSKKKITNGEEEQGICHSQEEREEGKYN